MSRFTVPCCRVCHWPLAPDEIEYYGDRCERCERAWLDRIEAWRRGAADPEFDDGDYFGESA